MEQITSTYDSNEDAWVSSVITIDLDIFLKIVLKEKGKVLIRQIDENIDVAPRVPIERHKDCDTFEFRVSVSTDIAKIQIFTSVEPKYISYANISQRHLLGHQSATNED